MAEKLLNIATVTEYNDMLGIETLHPLVSVIDLSKAKPMHHMRHTFSFYTIYLKDEVNCELIYGRQKYDYKKGSVVCLAPGQVIGIEDTGEVFQPKGWALCFDPDLIRGTSLAKRMSEYSYFSYNVNEALHLSKQEREIFIDCLNKISMELNHFTDRLSKRLIVTNIELLLDYCLRFYERQFITREPVNSDLLSRFELLIDSYLHSPRLATEGIPNVKWCASELCLSPNYFGDLIKKETGKTPKDHIQTKIIELAKERLFLADKTVSQIAYELGFQYPQHFTRLFKSVTGMTPNQYRNDKELTLN
ncbi:MAG: helix-turn-helix domain-containing protein [Muribaculaceae bacterium]|nr:helix-turn-helix domain-containing protein [Muribaculaceae bacterium]